MIGVYRIVHVATGREYIGQSIDIPNRWKGHIRRFRSSRGHHSPHLHAAWLKYGPEAFAFEVLELCDADALDATEQKWIDARKPAFNVAPVVGSTRGVRQSEEARARKRGRKASAETRAKMSAARKGRAIPDEQRVKLADALRGRKRPPETIEKMRAAFTGKRLSDEARQRMSDGQKGRKHTPESIAKRVATRAANRATKLARAAES